MRRAAALATLLAFGLVAGGAGAQQVPGDAGPLSAGSPADAAEEAGPAVDLSVMYAAELWAARGRRRHLDNLDVTLTVDAERALGWRGATLFAYALYNNGRSLSEVVGEAQTVSNIETGVRAVRLYEAWVDQRLGPRASVRVGLYDLNSEFDTSEAGSLFVNSSHGVGPDLAQSGRNGPSIFPVTSLAARVEWTPAERWRVRAAALDGVPGDPARPRRTAVKLGGNDGALLIGEVEYRDGRTKAALGAWGYTARFEGIASGLRRRDSRGAYLLVERRVAAAQDGRALAAFARIGFAEARVNAIGRYLGAGLVRTGVLARDDRLGVAVARASFGRPYRRATGAGRAETVVELTYRAALTPWLTVQPDAQYVVDPGGDPGLRNALALGLRAEVGF